MPTTQTCLSINGIILRSTKVKMVWINTRRVIASMTDIKNVIQLSSFNKHSHSMRSYIAAQFVMPYLAITSRMKTSLPYPAFVWFSRSNFFPESIFNRSRGRAASLYTKWVSSFRPTGVVLRAPSATINSIGTIMNRTGFHRGILPQLIGDIL